MVFQCIAAVWELRNVVSKIAVTFNDVHACLLMSVADDENVDGFSFP